ncbi:MAG TPA: M1 family metallopeptidase [Gemmatimonadales bacterium]|nr:M1 family metallopeptidase [Gemmatimonadales bacterium]
MRSLLIAGIALGLASALAAQQPPAAPTIQPAVLDTGIFSPLPLRPGNDIRTADGRPGPRYWQQRVSYSITATLDTAAKRLTGHERITYTNHSPLTLDHLYVQLDQNLFKPGSVGSKLFPAESRFGGAGFDGGFVVSDMTQSAPARAGARARIAAKPLKGRVDDTMMFVELATPLAPGATTVISLDFAFNIPEHGADRMGRDGSLYELAQWYPRLAVYDDIRGWNTDQYQGQGEFYLEYGDFDYAVTVPAGYIVAGTGMVANPLEVLTPRQRARLAAARTSDTTVHIVTEAELADGSARPARTGTSTWRFSAKNVRDVAWATSPEYIWDAQGYDGHYAFAYYRPSAKELWQEASKMAAFSIKEYSEHWLPYPYPQISAVEGPVSGMEYPMLAMESRNDSREELYAVVTHEIGHMWYPMVVGSNERLYAWMDEGFNTFINTFSEEDYFKRNDALRRLGEERFVMTADQEPTAQPIMTAANRYRNDNNLGELAYVKPSIALLALRNQVLGPEVFDKAFAEYTRRWAFKHPTPDDFFRTMEDMSGRDLSWFWRGWFYSTDALDQAIAGVTQKADSAGGNAVSITVKNVGQQVMPVKVTLTLADSTTQVVSLPVDVWYFGDSAVAETTTPKPVIKAQLWAGSWFKDLNPRNDTWTTGQ